jgi:hypothetical protein
LRQAQNNLRSEVNYLANENERLQRNLLKLDGAVTQLEGIERELSRIAGSFQNVNRLVEIVAEQNEVHERMKKNLKSSILQTILGVVTKSDADGDFIISSKELQVLIVRLGMMDGVQFQEGNFRKLLTQSSCVSSIMSMIRSLLQENDETVFMLRPEELSRR